MSDKIIKLTQFINKEEKEEGFSTIEMFTKISAFAKKPGDDFTHVFVPWLPNQESVVHAKETPEEIMELLKDNMTVADYKLKHKIEEVLKLFSSRLQSLEEKIQNLTKGDTEDGNSSD